MKSSKVFFLGLLVSLSASGLQAAEALEQEVKEQAEVKQARALSPDMQQALQEWIVQNQLRSRRAAGGKLPELLRWPAGLTKKIEEYTPTFEEESVVLGEKYGTITSFFISPDERYIALAFSGSLVVYDLQNLQEKLNIPMRDSETHSVLFFPQQNQYLMALVMQPAEDSQRSLNKIRLYDLNNLKKAPRVLSGSLFELDEHTQYAIFKPFNKKSYGLYQLPDLQAKLVFPEFERENTMFHFSSGGRYLALENSAEHNIMVYDLEDVEKVPKILEGSGIEFSPDGHSAAVYAHDSDQTLFYTLSNFEREPRSLEGRNLEFSPQGQYVAMHSELENGDNQIRLYKRDDFDTALQEFTSQFNTLWFFPGERYVAVKKSGDKNQIKIYDMHNFNAAPQVMVGDIISPSKGGHYVALWRYQGLIDLYARDNLDKPLVSVKHNFVDQFSPRDRYFVTESAAGGITVYNLLALKKRVEKEKEQAKLAPIPEESTSDWLKRFSEFSIEQMVPKE